MPKSHIIAVVEGFNDWSRPWCFLEAVLSHESLSHADQIVVRSIWADACNPGYWEVSDLTLGVDTATRALRTSFTWVSDIALSHFVRAAAYEWQ